MTLILSVLLAALFTNLGLGILVFRTQRQSVTNRLFLFITLSIVSWTFSKILFYFSNTAITNGVAIPLLYLSGISIVTTFIFFAYAFPNPSAHFTKWFYIGILPIPILFSLMLFTGNMFIGELTEINGVRGVEIGPFYFLYTLLIIGYFIAGHVILFRKLQKSTGILQVQLIYVILGSSIASISGVFTNLILPWFGIFTVYWLGPPLTLAMVVLFTYSIIKHHLLSARVIATELFTAIILIVALINALLSDTMSEFAAQMGIFAVLLVFGIFLIRGTLREIKELERLSKAKSDFVAIVSHQLRTPLTTIKGFISMIKEGSGTEEDRKEWLDKAYITNERMIRLVNDILNISRIERGDLQYNFTEVNPIKLVEETIDALRIQAEEKGIALNWEKPQYDIPAVRADEEKLRQVIINLIDNAIHYTDKGHISVRLAYLRDLNRIKITVQDTGIGMTAEDIKNLFEQFSRGRGGQKNNIEGLGLGLYVAQNIVKAHSGKLWAESDGLHKGSRFYIELPLQ